MNYQDANYQDDGQNIPFLPDAPDAVPDKDHSLGIPAHGQTPLQNDKPSGRVIALTGASGGAGTTAIAVQMACDLQARLSAQTPLSGQKEDARVCLFDLDFEAGGVANALDIQPCLKVEDLAQSESKIDAVFAAAIVSSHESGFAVVASEASFSGNRKVNPLAVLTLMDVLCTMFDIVILDVPTGWMPWTKPVLMGSDHAALIAELTVPGVKRAGLRQAAIRAEINQNQALPILLNKVERRALRSGLKVRDAEKTLEQPLLGSICTDPSLVQDALNRGDPCSEIRPDARFVKDVRTVLDVWDVEWAAKLLRNA